MMTPEELEDLKQSLPRGYYSKVCEKVTWSKRKVALFFSGEKYDLEIHRAAIEVAEDWALQKKEVSERFNAIKNAE